MAKALLLVALLALMAGGLSSSALNSAAGAVTPAKPTRAQIEQAEGLKTQANELFKLKRFQEALQVYQQAADMNPTSAMILCNRAFAHIKLENYGQAVADAEKSIELDPTFIKAYYRRGTARMSLGKSKLALQDFRTVNRLRPSDPTAQAKLKQCEKIVKLEAFEAAIRAQDQPSPIQNLQQTINEMQVEEDYDGPRWEDGPMTQAFVEGMIERFQNDKRIHKKYLYKIVLQAHQLHAELQNVEKLEISTGKHLTVCGDTHGQFYDVLKIFEINGCPSAANPYLFNGDYVDRGSWSLEVVTTLLAYKCLDANAVHLTRGNHETVAMNRMYGFEGEVRAKHSKHMYDCFVELFTVLPLAFILNEKVLVTHGGLPSPGTTLEDMQKAERRLEPGDSGIVCDLLWSDPQPDHGRAPSKRGTGYMFGPDICHEWLDANGLQLLVRSHEMKEEGYAVEHDGRCITIFSAPNYCDQMGNLGAFIKFEQDCTPHFTTFTAAPHPDIRAMKYAPIAGMGMMGNA